MSSLALSLDAVSIEANQDTSSSEDEESESSDLHAAAKTGDVAELTRLLNDGAAVDQAKGDGATPLCVACEHGHVAAARLLLLDNGADVHKASNDNRTPLHEASYKGHVDVVQLLLANGAGADLDVKDKSGDTPVADAKSKGHSAVVALLEEHLDLRFPLHAAARTGDVDAMTQLLDGDAEVDAKKDRTTPLFVACEHGHF